jgi:hypothetical protein
VLQVEWEGRENSKPATKEHLIAEALRNWNSLVALILPCKSSVVSGLAFNDVPLSRLGLSSAL